MYSLLWGWPDKNRAPLVVLSTSSWQIEIWNTQGLHVAKTHIKYTITSFILDTDTPYIIRLIGDTRHCHPAQVPNISNLNDIVIRSCDNSGLSFRERSIATLAAEKPKAIITLGDIIYADIYRPTLAGQVFETYYSVWCKSLAPLLSITTQCANLFIADDHEINDNVDMDHLTGEETIGFQLVCDIYQALAQLIRKGGPYDNYILPISPQQDLVFYGHMDKSFLRNIVQTKAKKLIILSNKPYILVKPAWMSRLYYSCVRCSETRVKRDGDADEEVFEILSMHPNAWFIGGDYHRMISGKYKQVNVRVTSPFSGIQFLGDETYLFDVNETSMASTFYKLMEDRHVLIETGLFERLWNGILTANYRLGGYCF